MGVYPTGVKYRRLNRAGAEYGAEWDGWTGETYTNISATKLTNELSYNVTKDFDVIRFPVAWECLQHII